MILDAPVRSAQLRLGRALRSRVAGDDAEAVARRIHGEDGPRWFTRTDPLWRVYEDASMFPGGVTALLLQSLHPLAMAGVAGHSGYKSDPWGRLQRTSTYLAATTFGTQRLATETIEHVKGIHARVRGKDHRGRPYRADDPHLLRWVHVAEAWSFLSAYRRYGPATLTAAEEDVFVEQAGRSAAMLGATDVPRTVAELDAALEGFRPELEVTGAAREAASFLLREPPLPLAAKTGYYLLAAGGVSLLPPWSRAMLGLPTAGPAIAAASAAGAVGTTTVRWAMSGVPHPSGRAPR